jgi:hypothetical protein
MGQAWFFEINIVPKKGKFEAVQKALEEINDKQGIPQDNFKDVQWDEDKAYNSISISGGTYSSYGYGGALFYELKGALEGLIESGTFNEWWGDQPQESKKLEKVTG